MSGMTPRTPRTPCAIIPEALAEDLALFIFNLDRTFSRDMTEAQHNQVIAAMQAVAQAAVICASHDNDGDVLFNRIYNDLWEQEHAAEVNRG